MPANFIWTADGKMTNKSTQTSVAYIGELHGYCFDGDFVQINAELNFSDAATSPEKAWSLQLWASEGGYPANKLAGVMGAEIGVDAVAGWSTLVGGVAALPPAGTAQQVMALALVADGELVDLAVYPVLESFVQPSLRGMVSCAVADDQVTLKVETIDNPRPADNLSGTLALEVWALDAPYAGGTQLGVPVASVILGILAGGNDWSASEFTVHAAAPEAAKFLTVMLREWTSAGYVTRDYRNFAATPAKVEAPVAAKAAAKAKPAAKAKAAVASKPAVAAKPAPAPVAKAVPAAKAEKAAAVPAAKPASAKGVSINTASEAELAAIKGLPRDVAKAIVAGRPYAKLDDVVKAKGMGLKKLAKLRDLLVL